MNPQGNNKYRHSIKEFNANTPKSYIGCFVVYTIHRIQREHSEVWNRCYDHVLCPLFLSLFCVTFYYFEDFGNIPIHSYITNSWQETIASPCSKILLFSTDKCWDTRSVISHSTPLWSDITAVILTRMTENTEFISDLNSNFGNLL